MQDVPQIAQMQNAFFPLVGALIFILLHFYIYKGLVKSVSTKPTIRLLWKVFVVVNMFGCIAYLFFRQNPIIPQAIYFLLSLSLGMAFVLFIATLLYQFCSLFIMMIRSKSERSRWRHRSKVGIFVLSLVMIVYGTFNGIKTPDVTSVKIELEGLTTPIRAVVLSDLHIGGLIESNKINEIVQIVNDLDVDMVFLTGDIVDARLADAEEAIDKLKGLQAKDGIFYVLGNHEYFHDIENIIAKIESLGFNVLINKSQIVNDNVNIVGIADLMGFRVGYLMPDFQEAFSQTNPALPTILLSHQPKVIEYLSNDDKVDLILSGHTHGGQIFPFSLAVLVQQPYLYGLHEIPNFLKTKIYVNQGTGFWGPPMRIGSYREITLLELTPPSSNP
ncbi:metallophosphoesterase [Helicobacter sp. MIT 05-5293]|uniref:metallophosphoesterase n=1 Tax=Helicobacter sp. MIT 05-5293 TaxID=1548149 RepID=UPI00051D06BD|nr:metallophosphoesterase [Helicobacter sp. MIT 05-5293]TLD81732.1 metallophosphoesterase [Helicobacter sp. MIT 05-5293]